MADALPSLAEIKAAFPGQLLIPLSAAAPFIAKTPAAAYKLASRGGFPGAKKVEGVWMVNVRKLAEFIDGPGDEKPVAAPGAASAAVAASSKPEGHASRDETSKTVRPPPISKMLLALRRGMEKKRAEIELLEELHLLNAVFAELEAGAIAGEDAPATRKKARTL